MEAYSYHSSSSSSSSSSSLIYSSTYPTEEKRTKPSPGFRSTLHSVRRIPAKPMIKKPIAPLPPTPPKVYKVDSVNFREVVQKLTGAAPESQPRRLKEVAPPPLNLSTGCDFVPLQLFPSPNEAPLSVTFHGLLTDAIDGKSQKLSDSLGAMSPLGFGLSPSSLAWCSNLLMSPGTLSSLERGTVL